MVKGAAIKFNNYEETIPKILTLLKLDSELKKYDKIVLKPHLKDHDSQTTNAQFTEHILKFVMENKNPVSEVFIAEGSDGVPTEEMFETNGYTKLAEKYPVGLVDLNTSETQEVELDGLLNFQSVQYPTLLTESFVISIPPLAEDEETGLVGSISNMLGAFPSSYYKGFFSSKKNKIRKGPIKNSIHDISLCKMPDFSVVDSSEKGTILAGLPFEIDKQSAKLLDLDWKAVPYLKLLSEKLQDSE